MVLNLDIKQTAPVVEPYEAALAALLAEYGRTRRRDRGVFPRPGHRRLRRAGPGGRHVGGRRWRRPSSGGAAHAGAELPASRAVAFQVPERQGDLVVRRRGFVEAAHRRRVAVHVWTVNDERRRWAAWSSRASTGSSRPADHGAERRLSGPVQRRGRPASADRRRRPLRRRPPPSRAQPRPQFGFLPWLAFFFERSLRFTVRFDMAEAV